MAHPTKIIKEYAVKAYFDKTPISVVEKMYQVDRSSVYRWVIQYKKNKNLDRKKKPGSGRRAKLSNKDIIKITKILLKPASYYGFETDFWTIDRIRKITKEKLKIDVSKTTMYDLLYTESYSYKKPEKRFYEANEADKKNWIENKIPEIVEYVKRKRAILYFEDESNISLNAVLGKTWGPVGKTTLHKSTGNKGSISAMSALSSSGRLIFTLHEKNITSIEVIHFLKQILAHHPRRNVVVVMDNAKPHTSKITKSYISTQKRLQVFYLPPRSPELNPDEKIWNYLKNEELKSHQAKTKSDLKKLTKNKLMSMSKKPKLLKALFKRCEVADLFLESSST